MVTPRASKETLKAMANLLGLEFSEQRLEELLPQVQQMVKEMAGLDVLDLNDVEPAIIFRPERG
ncbi:MAG: hypothetical protein JRJ02_05900 [Deltaproteobacteria bacterium]|nr:hypothetical protein [Deltaproteobacteria bacterium]MBW1861891.1 hypothetical protein [Deltaproteobacteria bacterium]